MIISRIDLERKTEVQEGFIIPYLLRPVEIMQGYHGPWSHFATEAKLNDSMTGPRLINDDSYSIDFKVPFETQVICSKDGIVEGAIESRRFYEGLDFEIGLNVLPGFIMIHHGRFFSLYSHMGRIEANIGYGAEVKQGQALGFTGKTGWVGPWPHLHFEVYEKSGHGRLSHPVKFEGYIPALEHSTIFSS